MTFALVLVFCITSAVATTCHPVMQDAPSLQQCATRGVLAEEAVASEIEARGFGVSVDWTCIQIGEDV